MNEIENMITKELINCFDHEKELVPSQLEECAKRIWLNILLFQEKAGREKGCEYCTGIEKPVYTAKYYNEETGEEWEEEISLLEVEAVFCHKCGRKLGEHDE